MSSNDISPPGPLWVGYDMTKIFAPFYWGTIVSLVLSGVTILQAYTYFPSKDRTSVQLVAAIMIILDFASTVLCAEGMYIYVVPQFGSLLPLGTLTISLSIECYLSVIITFISQLYFAWQIWTVLHNRLMLRYTLSGSVILFGVVAFVGGIACSTFMIIDNANILAARSYRFAVAVGVAKGAAALSDVIATISLCYCLGSASTSFKHTQSMIKTLMGYIIQRGILVTLIQILFLILFFGTSQRLYWLALHVNVTRLYANTFFAMLNGRDRFHKASSGDGSTFAVSAHLSRFAARGDPSTTEMSLNQNFSQDKYAKGGQHSEDGPVRIDTTVIKSNI